MQTALRVLLLVTLVPAVSAAQSATTDAVTAELVGRWSLIALIRNGVDVTRTGLTQVPVASLYDLKRDGTFTISLGEKIQETGTWSANATAVPKISTMSHTCRTAGGRECPASTRSAEAH